MVNSHAIPHTVPIKATDKKSNIVFIFPLDNSCRACMMAPDNEHTHTQAMDSNHFDNIAEVIGSDIYY